MVNTPCILPECPILVMFRLCYRYVGLRTS